MRSAGVPVITGYPSGRQTVDLCISKDRRDIGIDCGVHSEGPDAHVERHLSLRRAGWDILEAYPSRWGSRRGELVVELLLRIGSTSQPTKG